MALAVLGGATQLLVRQERVVVGKSARLLYVSDLHLGLPWTRGVARLVREAVETTGPDAVLLGGDLIERAVGLADLHTLVADIAATVPLGAVPGNHDGRTGRARIRNAVIDAGGHWLFDAALRVGGLVVDGRVDSTSASHVLCAHDPALWPRALSAGYALTLAGHLHGCQFTFAARAGRDYPGAWFYRWNGPRFEDAGRTLLVSRGVADTLPLRWNCPHDVLLVECV